MYKGLNMQQIHQMYEDAKSADEYNRISKDRVVEYSKSIKAEFKLDIVVVKLFGDPENTTDVQSLILDGDFEGLIPFDFCIPDFNSMLHTRIMAFRRGMAGNKEVDLRTLTPLIFQQIIDLQGIVVSWKKEDEEINVSEG